MLHTYTIECLDTKNYIQQELDDFLKSKKLKADGHVIDSHDNKAHWSTRLLSDLILKAERGDIIVIYEINHLARSTLQVLEVFSFLVDKGVQLYIVKQDKSFIPEKFFPTEELLDLIRHIDKSFIVKRTTDALERRREAGLPFGRPKGRKNKKRKLDEFKPEIMKYLDLNLNKFSISKLIGCHVQTLTNYLDDHDYFASERGKTSPKKVKEQA